MECVNCGSSIGYYYLSSLEAACQSCGQRYRIEQKNSSMGSVKNLSLVAAGIGAVAAAVLTGDTEPLQEMASEHIDEVLGGGG